MAGLQEEEVAMHNRSSNSSSTSSRSNNNAPKTKLEDHEQDAHDKTYRIEDKQEDDQSDSEWLKVENEDDDPNEIQDEGHAVYAGGYKTYAWRDAAQLALSIPQKQKIIKTFPWKTYEWSSSPTRFPVIQMTPRRYIFNTLQLLL